MTQPLPLDRPQWTSGAAIEVIVRESPADEALLDDLAAVRAEVIDLRFVGGREQRLRH